MEKESYTKEDKECTHCGGNVSGNCCGERIIYWCDDCGSNNKLFAPNVKLKFSN